MGHTIISALLTAHAQLFITCDIYTLNVRTCGPESRRGRINMSLCWSVLRHLCISPDSGLSHRTGAKERCHRSSIRFRAEYETIIVLNYREETHPAR
jgi:hypothetical protein